MALEPTLQEQQVLVETIERPEARLAGREFRSELFVAVSFALVVAAMWLARPPHGFSLGPAAVCVVLLAVAMRLRFDTPLGFTVPTQLAFVPLVFAVPVAVLPIAVLIALTLGRLPDVLAGRLRPTRLFTTIGNSWFAIGPATVFVVAHAQPSHASVLLLVVALAAQFVVDFSISSFRDAAHGFSGVSWQLSDLWVNGVDAALSPVGLLATDRIHSPVLGSLAVLSLLGVLAMFAHERRRRLLGLLELNSAYRGTALVLGDVIEADDGYTGAHSKGVVSLALAVGARLGLDPERLRNLEFAALLHDVGKIAIPKEIINKPGRLDPAEWTIVKTHTVEGEKMLRRVGGFMGEVGQIIRSHHERWDGAGYPDQLAGEAIPLESRIIACCDTWNAMRTDRPYRKALAHEQALHELAVSAGSQLDPEIVGTLLTVVAPEQDAARTRALLSRSAQLSLSGS